MPSLEDLSNLTLTSASPSLKPIELSFPLPKNPHTVLHLHLTCLATSTLLFLTTTTVGESGTTRSAVGSFVYAMPDRTNPSNTLSTALYTSPPSIDYATRLAKILARRTHLPVYVGCSGGGVAGATVEEETEGLAKVVDTVLAKWGERRQD